MENNLNKKLKACGYVRVSTRSEHLRHSFDEQIDYWTTTLSNNLDYEFIKVYSDYGYNGKIGNRPAYNSMISDALDGKIDLIFCKSIARFGRNITTVLDDIHKLRDRGIFVDFEIENIKTSNSLKDLYLTVYTAIAENELNSTSDSIKFGFREKFKQGSSICKPIFDYDVVKTEEDYDFTIIEEQSKTVKLISNLYVSDNSFTEIAKHLTENGHLNKYGNTEWNPTMIPYILSNEKYVGIVYSQKTYNKNFKSKKNDVDYPAVNMYAIENHHEPIIALGIFEAAKEKLSNRKKKPIRNKSKSKDFISEVLHCATCGSRYKKTVRKNYHNEDVITYRCGKTRYKGESCYNSTMYPDTFENQFIRAYNEFTKVKESNTEKGQTLIALVAAKESEITDLRKTRNIGNIDDDTFVAQLDPLLKELDALKYNLDVEVGHIINSKRIPYKITYYKEELATKVLEKVMVNDNKLLYIFKNGVSIEREFVNPTPGRQSKKDSVSVEN